MYNSETKQNTDQKNEIIISKLPNVKRITILILFLLMASVETFSQNYQQSAGFRLGAASGLTYRRFLAQDISGELMLLTQNHGKVLAFVVQKHKPALLFDDLDVTFIYGAGAHIGVADRFRIHNDNYDYEYNHRHYTTLQLGLDAFASFEYQVPRYPVTVSLECKPYFELFDDHLFGIHMPVIAFGARYTF
ncbi:MAG: hypothetical protein FD166_879 [Bacteroidetes bacterium]|nr:MAG: hypothetical protein FD166_879 [Bacteroidota bacterium]